MHTNMYLKKEFKENKITIIFALQKCDSIFATSSNAIHTFDAESQSTHKYYNDENVGEALGIRGPWVSTGCGH